MLKTLKIVGSVLFFLYAIVRFIVVLTFSILWIALEFTLSLAGLSFSHKNYNYR